MRPSLVGHWPTADLLPAAVLADLSCSRPGPAEHEEDLIGGFVTLRPSASTAKLKRVRSLLPAPLCCDGCARKKSTHSNFLRRDRKRKQVARSIRRARMSRRRRLQNLLPRRRRSEWPRAHPHRHEVAREPCPKTVCASPPTCSCCS